MAVKRISKKGKKDIRRGRKVSKGLKELKRLPADDPLQRHEGTTMDLYHSIKENNSLSNLRLAALKHTQEMPTLDTKIGKWLQLGPTAIAYGQTDSPSRVLVTGRITSIVVDPTDPNIIYVGAAQGGVWKTTDGGRNWMAKSDKAESLAIGALVMDPTDHKVLYAGTGEGNILFKPSYYGVGVLKTTNGGEDWKLYGGQDDNGPFSGARFFRLAINPLDPRIIFAATTYGVYRSINSGEDWTQMTDNLPPISNTIIAATDIVINPVNPTIAYAAFWGDGIYKTINADDETPKWSRLTIGLPPNDFTRIALGISYSSPETLYTLMANDNFIIDKFYRSTDSGSSWNPILLPNTIVYGRTYNNSIGGQGYYNLNIAVDPTTPDVIYLGGVPLIKAVRNTRTNIWGFTNIGTNIHTDHHAFAFRPTDNFVIYAGSDGGIYKSSDAGNKWDDTINEGLCITQFEFMDQHPDSDAVIFGGTQDNGTLQFRNNSAFYQVAEADGGYVAIDPKKPNIIFHEYQRPYGLYRSEEGGKYGRKEDGGSWENVFTPDPTQTSLFYAPFTLDQEDSRNIAFGTDRIFLDTNQGLNKWRKEGGSEYSFFVTLRLLESNEAVSAINYVNSDPGLIYVGTSLGKVFRLTKNKSTWNAKALYTSDLPAEFIWDIVPVPDNINTVIVVMAGFGKPHVWRGKFLANGKETIWENISGSKPDGDLPNVPANAIVIEPNKSDTMYVGTDVGVFITTDGGKRWTKFGQGFPNCAVFDMRLHVHKQLLRAVTHGRGIWEIKLDRQTVPDVNIFVRDHLMDTGWEPSSDITVPFDDLLRDIKLGDQLSWSMCADIKIDPPFYQMDVEDVDYVKFENRLKHRNPQRGYVNRVYVQIHNRGIKAVDEKKPVKVRIFYANLSNESPSRYPNLPQDFWTAFPNDPKDTSNWKPIGKAKDLPSGPKTLTNTEPTVLAWEWDVPSDTSDRICLLVIIDSPEDPIPESNKKIFNIGDLVSNEKHVGLIDLNVVNGEKS
jgi:hypothetical protein